ncbi:MAG: sigma-70 family RNA polymerase sigma factor [Bacteroidaceae bacterium]|jgi:RNA polymerase sigma-70 factor (ECF subfamily)|nr:sigma-70 family RNA polymerase sigma factor [Bacteroidaceae bacterium]
MERDIIQQLFRQHYAKMQRVAQTLLCDGQESEDVVSDIFEQLLSSGIALMPGTEERYLLTSVRNRCLKRLRHQAVKRNAPIPEATDEDDAADGRLTDIVEFVVSHLSPQEQRIFGLRFTDGFTYEEIAQAEGISRVAVWKHLSHAITAIKKQFGQKTI